ncbi:MAG: PTS glucose transporter subunit IIA, partial [Metamycoplasmataceae bacterium]
KDKKTVGTAVSGGISANLGITEPAIFGINLPLKYIFVGGMIGGFFGGYWLGMTQTVASSMGTASWLGIIQFSFAFDDNVVAWYEKVAESTPWGKDLDGLGLVPAVNFIIAMTITSIGAFLSTVILSVRAKNRAVIRKMNNTEVDAVIVQKLGSVVEKIEKPFANLKAKINKDQNINYIYAPCDGYLIPKEEIQDVAFQNDLMGPTFAIQPKNNNETIINAPFKGNISNIFPTGHAVTIKAKNDITMLMHIGTETAKLNLDAENLRELKYIKLSKFIGSNIKAKSKVAEFKHNSLIEAGANSEIIYNVVLYESIKESDNKQIEIIKHSGEVVAGEVIARIY